MKANGKNKNKYTAKERENIMTIIENVNSLSAEMDIFEQIARCETREELMAILWPADVKKTLE